MTRPLRDLTAATQALAATNLTAQDINARFNEINSLTGQRFIPTTGIDIPAQGKDSRISKLPDLPAQPSGKRRILLPKFKLDISDLRDFGMRLHRTMIYVGGQPYYIYDMAPQDRDVLLHLQDYKGDSYKILYSHPDIDLRSPEPQYIVHQDNPVYLVRVPQKQQQQGLSSNNTYLKSLGGGNHRFSNIHSVMEGLIKQETLEWKSVYAELMLRARAMKAIRMSRSVAIYRDESDDVDKITVEYRGRALGEMKENDILVAESDASKPWIKKDVSSIGCQMRVQC